MRELLYMVALRREGEQVSFPVEGVDGGSISMLSVRVKADAFLGLRLCGLTRPAWCAAAVEGAVRWQDQPLALVVGFEAVSVHCFHACGLTG